MLKSHTDLSGDKETLRLRVSSYYIIEKGK